MTGQSDWQWKLREAVDTIKARYDQIGRKTGAPFLAVVYPPEAEAAVPGMACPCFHAQASI